MAASEIRKEFPKKGSGGGCLGPRGSKGRAPASTNVAVRNLSLSVTEGEVLGLLGPNGAGKTTSMNVITAETKATSGQVREKGRRRGSRMQKTI